MTPDFATLPDSAGPEAVLADLIGRASEEPVAVIALTDEELTVLDGGLDIDQVSPLPWLAAHDEAGRVLICQTALRGLVARGLVLPVGTGDDEVRPAMHNGLAGVLTMRRTADAIVFAQRQSAGDERSRVLFLRSAVVLEEDVSPNGLHRLTMATIPAAAERLARFADPLNVADQGKTRPPRTVTLTEMASAAGATDLRDARVVTVFGRTGSGDADEDGEERCTVYAFGNHLLLAEPTTSGDQAALVLTGLGAQALTHRMMLLLAPKAGPPIGVVRRT
jgi:hypothetical protein